MSRPDFSYERKLWKRGYSQVIGVDEVGRGAFAGAVVAAAVAYKNIKYQISNIKNSPILKTILNLGINDSKRLSPKKRRQLAKEIKKYFYWEIGKGSVAEINRFGIKLATEKAMRRAIRRIMNHESGVMNKGATSSKCYLLVDAFHIRYVMGIGLKNQKAIINGDRRSVSIAAASIVAKVYRDALMQKLSQRYSKYHWHKNMGYGTLEHRQAILGYGMNKYHRVKFVQTWLTHFNTSGVQ